MKMRNNVTKTRERRQEEKTHCKISFFYNTFPIIELLRESRSCDFMLQINPCMEKYQEENNAGVVGTGNMENHGENFVRQIEK